MSTPRTLGFPVTGPMNLSARLGHGSITVDTRDDLAEATVTLSARDPASDVLDHAVVELRGPTLVVHLPRQGGRFDLPLFGGRAAERDAVDVTVTVPTGTAMKLSATTASIRVSGRCGGAEVSAGSADIRLDHVDGDLRLRYGSGSSSVERVTGSVTARSGSGSARFGEVGGDLAASCGSGLLEVGTARGAVRSRAGSGSATLGAVHGDVDLASGSGAVSIGVPEGVSVRLDVATGSGVVHSQLPVEQVRTGTGPAIVLRARTGTGSLSLHRAA